MFIIVIIIIIIIITKALYSTLTLVSYLTPVLGVFNKCL
jgi:hypothetical protein